MNMNMNLFYSAVRPIRPSSPISNNKPREEESTKRKKKGKSENEIPFGVILEILEKNEPIR